VPPEVDARVVEFQNWLRHHRGISERSVPSLQTTTPSAFARS
jgi:hypothetical protein